MKKADHLIKSEKGSDWESFERGIKRDLEDVLIMINKLKQGKYLLRIELIEEDQQLFNSETKIRK